MVDPSPELCRVALHAGSDTDAVQVDVAMPAMVPVAALIPSILDLLADRPGCGDRRWVAHPGTRYRLCRPGEAPLDGSQTLAQQAIRDGTVLLLMRAIPTPPAPRFDDPAEHLAAKVRVAARPWRPRATRLAVVLAAGWLGGLGVTGAGLAGQSGFAAVASTLGSGCALLGAVFADRVHRDAATTLTLALSAVGFAAGAGLMVVPGGPGAPNVLLAATAAAAVAVLALQWARCAGPAMTAVCWLAALAAAAALVVVLGRVSVQVIGATAAAISIGLLQAAARVAIVGTGLSRRLHQRRPEEHEEHAAIRAHDLLTGLTAACSAAAAAGAAAVAVAGYRGGAPWFAGATFAAVCGAALLFRIRSHTDRSQIAALVIGAVAALSAAVAAASQPLVWLGVTAAAPVGAVVYLGGAVRDAQGWPPAVCRAVELLEHLTLVAVVPVACWVCGCYGAVRGLIPG